MVLGLGIKVADLFAVIHPHASMEFDVSFMTPVIMEAFLTRQELVKGTARWKVFRVVALSRQEEVKDVTILVRNESLPPQDIVTWLSRFGQLLGPLRKNLDPRGIWTGAWHVKVKLGRQGNSVRHIPASAFIGRDRILAFYPGQPRLCFKCGSPTHFSADCTTTKCVRCGGLGHDAEGCAQIRCNLCGVMGHPFSRCPKAFRGYTSGAGGGETGAGNGGTGSGGAGPGDRQGPEAPEEERGAAAGPQAEAEPVEVPVAKPAAKGRAAQRRQERRRAAREGEGGEGSGVVTRARGALEERGEVEEQVAVGGQVEGAEAPAPSVRPKKVIAPGGRGEENPSEVEEMEVAGPASLGSQKRGRDCGSSDPSGGEEAEGDLQWDLEPGWEEVRSQGRRRRKGTRRSPRVAVGVMSDCVSFSNQFGFLTSSDSEEDL